MTFAALYLKHTQKLLNRCTVAPPYINIITCTLLQTRGAVL